MLVPSIATIPFHLAIGIHLDEYSISISTRSGTTLYVTIPRLVSRISKNI